MSSTIPYIALAVVACCLVIAAAWSQMFSIKLTKGTWNELVAGLSAIEMGNVRVVARDYLNPHKGQIDHSPGEIWKLVGGIEGLQRMNDNANRMLALAAFAQQWNHDEAAIVAEQMRRDAVALRKAVLRVELGLVPHRLFRKWQMASFLSAQEAASSYYLMRQRLLALYETSHAGLLPQLAAAL